MGNQGHTFRVRESTLLLMLPGMTVNTFMEACHNAASPLTLVLVDGQELTGVHLFRQYERFCSDYQED